MGPIVVITVGILLTIVIVGILIRLLDERVVARKLKFQQRDLRRDLGQIDHSLSKMERVAKLRVMEGMINGRRCKSCNEVKPRDGFVQIGEDHVGRPIEVCGECRDIVGPREGDE